MSGIQIDKEFILTEPTSDYFASALTGANWVLSENASPENVAYIVSLTNLSATDHTDKTWTIVGHDADGNIQTETLIMPGSSGGTSNVIKTKKYYSYITSIVPSATIGADTMNLTYFAQAVSQSFAIDYNGGVASLGYIIDATGTVQYTGQYTLAKLESGNIPTFISVSSASSIYQQTESNAEAFIGKPTALRIKIDSFSGTQTDRIQITQ